VVPVIIDHSFDTSHNAVYIQINHFIQIMLYIETFSTLLSSSKNPNGFLPPLKLTVSNNIDIASKQ
jgi:hypothetical protein